MFKIEHYKENYNIEFCIDSNTYRYDSIDSILEEKLVNILDESLFKRVKDFYDIYLLDLVYYKVNENKLINNIRDKFKYIILAKMSSTIPFNYDTMSRVSTIWNNYELKYDHLEYNFNIIKFSHIFSVIYKYYSKIYFLFIKIKSSIMKNMFTLLFYYQINV